jgi:hypothetical protein
MFPNSLSPKLGRKAGSYERHFIRDVAIRSRPPRNPRVERLIMAGWIVILAKSYGVLWIFSHYQVPVSPLWVIAPTVAFACLCTAVYHWRH